MKQFLVLVTVFMGTMAFSQEVVRPILVNPALYNPTPQNRASEHNALDSTFLYTFGSIELKHVWDDFSSNKFENFKAGYAESGVTSELFYHLMDPTNTIPQDPAAIFCDGEFAHQDTVKIDAEGGLIERVTIYPFDAYNVWVNDLDFYPVEGELIENLYQECYVLIDSIIDGILDDDQDTIWYNTIPGPSLFQDSARVFTKNVTDTTTLWIDNFAYHNYTFAEKPWSLGVATFDGVDQYGTPYAFGDLSAHGVADYMTSRPIDLSGVPASDEVYLTFIYQAEGFGNMPEANDSLLIDFYDPRVGFQTWKTQPWYANGESIAADVWDTVRIPVSPVLYVDGFQFRIKNYATLSGALDHWHVDYVSLDVQLTPEIGIFSDLAISYPVNTLLKDYTAVPWDHYKNTAGNEKIKSDIPLLIYNSDNTPTNFNSGLWTLKKDGVLESTYPIPGTGGPDDAQYVVNYNDCSIPINPGFYFDQTLGGDQAKFDFKLNISSGTDISNKHLENDTTTFTQRFDNYYAYDDGSAEAAYGIEGAGALMAYKFEAYESGELTGILMHFVPSVTDYSDQIFLLTVWADDGGQPGEIIYQDDYFAAHTPEYSGGLNAFRYYTFTRDEYLVDGYLPVDEIFYVGWQNIGSPSLNVGLDWNIDNGDKVFRNTGGEWLTSSFEMSLMIRPVFSTALDYTLSNERLNFTSAEEKIMIYPNPTNDQFTVVGVPTNGLVQLIDLSGRLVFSTNETANIDVSSLEKGVYIVAVQDTNGVTSHSSKLIIQ